MALVVYSDNRDSTGTLLQTLVVVATALAGAAAWLWARLQASGAAQLPLEQAADELAEQLRRQWDRAAADRGLTYPGSISLRWRWSPRQVTSSIREVVGGSGAVRFAPLPGMAAVTDKDLRSGELNDLLRVYSGVDSGRLVILGEPGAGKSSTGIRLLRDALIARASVNASERVQIPVPVLITLSGWDPINEPLVSWLATRLVRDYALLRSPKYGRDVATRLIEGRYLTMILDGLDEMPEALRPVTLRALDEYAIFRLVILTRSEELVVTVNEAHLRGAAALELLPVDPDQGADYLTRCQIDPLPPSWQHLVDHLYQHPTGVVAQALDTPLMLSLIRDNYGPGDKVDELLDGNRFATREAIEDHLLAQVLPAAYSQRLGQPPPPYTVDQARWWLGQLARQMNEDGTRDFAWWRIPRWTPAWPRILITVFVLSILTVPPYVLVAHLHLPMSEIGSQIMPVAYLGDALISCFIFGFWLLFVSTHSGELSSKRGASRWGRTDTQMILFISFLVGLVTGFQFWCGYGYGNGRGPVAGLVMGLVTWLVVGLGFLLSAESPRQWGWLPWSRPVTTPTLVSSLVFGFFVGLIVGFGVGFVSGLVSGLVVGLVVGLVAGIAYGLAIMFGGGPSWRRSRPSWNRINILVNFLIGLIIGSVVGLGAAMAYGLAIVFGGGPSRQRGRLRWSRTANPTNLFIGLFFSLVVGLILGVVYQFGLVAGLVGGLFVGLVVGFMFEFGQVSTLPVSPLDPRSLWYRERQFGILMGLGVGLSYGLVSALMVRLMHPDYGFGYGFGYGLVAVPVVGLGVGLVSSATWVTVLANAQLWHRNKAPLRLMRFLDDACDRQVLRTVGPVYQFRHAQLQDQLAGIRGEAMQTQPPRPH